MEYRKLGNSGLALSAITYGAFAIGGNMWGGNERKDSIAAVHASLDNGVTSFDTAPFYGYGLSEEIIGEALRGKDRTKVQLLTKFGAFYGMEATKAKANFSLMPMIMEGLSPFINMHPGKI